MDAGREQILCYHGRPQDWGNPRWKYYKFTLIDHGAGYENECHCWLDTSYKKPEGTPGELFASLITMILRPGTPVNKCSNEYLDEEDFWNKEWGPRPPWIPEEEEELW